MVHTAAVLIFPHTDRPSDDVKRDVTSALRAAAALAARKYAKHTDRGNTLTVLKVARALDPANLRATFTAEAPPPEYFQLVSPRHVLLTSEWVKFRHMDVGVRRRPDEAPLEMRTFWNEEAKRFPVMANLAERVLTSASGIAGVERELKCLRKIQAPDRLSMSMTTLESLMLIRCNRSVVDVYIQ